MKKILILTAILMLVTIPVEAQCAMCRAVLESEGDSNMAEGVNNGIIYLMAIPYILVGGLIWYIYKTKKKSKSS